MTHSRGFRWDEAAVRQLRSLALTGMSSNQIAIALGLGVSRSAVIGKLYRLGLCTSARSGTPVRSAKPAPVQLPRPHRSAVVTVQPEPVDVSASVVAPYGCQPIAFQQLTEDSCRAPIGGLYCGLPVERHARFKYCTEHRAQMITRPKPREKGVPYVPRKTTWRSI